MSASTKKLIAFVASILAFAVVHADAYPGITAPPNYNGYSWGWGYDPNDGNLHPLQVDANGNLQTTANVTISPGSVTIGAVNQGTHGTDPWEMTMYVGATPLAFGQTTMSASLPVTLASNQSLPLPAGASTAAKQPALGTAGTPSSDVLTVQGATSMTPLKTDPSGVTSPVSIATLPALPANQSTNINQLGGTSIAVGAGASNAGTARVMLSSDSTVAVNNTDLTSNGTVSSATTVCSISMAGYAGLGANITSVGTGNTIVFESSTDGGTTWSSISDAAKGTGNLSTIGETATGQYTIFTQGGSSTVRARVSVYGSGNVSVAFCATVLPTGITYTTAACPSTIESTAVLGDNATFIGNWHDKGKTGATCVTAESYSNLVSLANGLIIQESGDTTNSNLTRNVNAVTATAATATICVAQIHMRYWRVTYSNVSGSGTQGNFALVTTESPVMTPSLTNGGNTQSAQSGTWTVQPGNTANTTAWKVDGSAVTQPVNVSQVNGVTTLTGTGAVGTGSQRVAVGTDTATIAGSAPGTAGSASSNVITVQGVASMTKLLVTPDSVALPANQSVNCAQMNGVATTMGNGVSGTGVQRVTLASDSTGQVALAAGTNSIGTVGQTVSANTQLQNAVTTTQNGTTFTCTGYNSINISTSGTCTSGTLSFWLAGADGVYNNYVAYYLPNSNGTQPLGQYVSDTFPWSGTHNWILPCTGFTSCQVRFTQSGSGNATAWVQGSPGAAPNSNNVNITGYPTVYTINGAGAYWDYGSGATTINTRRTVRGGDTVGYMSTKTTTTFKSGAGVLHNLLIGSIGTAMTITIYDNTAGSGTVIFGPLTPTVAGEFNFDAAYSTGLTLVVGGTTAGNLTVTYN